MDWDGAKEGKIKLSVEINVRSFKRLCLYYPTMARVIWEHLVFSVRSGCGWVRI